MNNRRFTARLALILCFSTLPFFAQMSAMAQNGSSDSGSQPSLTRPTVLSRPAPVPAPPAINIPTTGTLPSLTPDAARPDAVAPEFPVVSGDLGILVQKLDGTTVMSQMADVGFNPASAVKLATALTALRAFGPDQRFSTAVWTNGTFDKATGTITGDLIVSGRDPSFHYEHAVMLARELNRQGIRTVTGDLIIAPKFTMNFDWSAQRSGDQLYDALDVNRRPTAASHAWNETRVMLGDTEGGQNVPSVAVMGAVYVNSVPPNARLLLLHRSSKLVDVLKVLLCYSNNFMAERIGDMVGGPEGVRRFLIEQVKVSPTEVMLASTSGLGVNRVTPRAMMQVFRALRDELAKHRLSPSDILPVAGVDPGTLQKRFTSYPSRGSVIAKTGTLVRTDSGASALVGQMNTAKGETLLFVIFNMHGNILRFRNYQDDLVTMLQNQNGRGGPAPFAYRPLTLSMRLSDTVNDPAVPARKDEYEGTN